MKALRARLGEAKPTKVHKLDSDDAARGSKLQK